MEAGEMCATPSTRSDDDTTLPIAAASRKPRGMRAIVCALLIVGACVTITAAAQGSAQTCTALANDVERLACYDRALRQAPSAPEAASSEAAPSAASAPSSSAAAPTGQAAPAPSLLEAPARETRPPTRDASAPSAPVANAATASSPSDLGVIVVVGMREAQGRALVFTAEDGRVWVQTDTQRSARRPQVPFRAEIREGTLSSRFLVTEEGRTYRVRRAE
jgi:hypothetical protein